MDAMEDGREPGRHMDTLELSKQVSASGRRGGGREGRRAMRAPNGPVIPGTDAQYPGL